jgi:ribosomal protein S18 acetylase RimI-like enzyme
MNKALTYLDYDSEFFKKKIFRILNEEIKKYSIKEIEKEIVQNEAEIIYAFSEVNGKNIDKLTKLDFHLINIRQTYSIDITFKDKQNNKNIKLLTEIKSSTSTIEQFSIPLSKTSRYYKDEVLKSSSSDFYTKWISNSFKNKKIYKLVYKDKKSLLGFVTFRIEKNEAFIDLVCVLPKIKNHGIGTALMQECLSFLNSKNIKTLFLVTQGENIDGIRFYEKQGFRIKNTQLVFHKHVK